MPCHGQTLLRPVTQILVVQVPRLAYPVFAIDTAAETLEFHRDPVDLVLAHLGNLVESTNAHFIQGFLDRRSDSLDLLQVIALSIDVRFVRCIVLPIVIGKIGRVFGSEEIFRIF